MQNYKMIAILLPEVEGENVPKVLRDICPLVSGSEIMCTGLFATSSCYQFYTRPPRLSPVEIWASKSVAYNESPERYRLHLLVRFFFFRGNS